MAEAPELYALSMGELELMLKHASQIANIKKVEDILQHISLRWPKNEQFDGSKYLKDAKNPEDRLYDLLQQPLHYVDSNKVTQQVKAILELHPEIVNCKFQRNYECTTPLIEACRNMNEGFFDIVPVLLQHGADICATGHIVMDNWGTRPGGYGGGDDIFPLFIATKRRSEPVVQKLLDEGAPVNQTNAIGQGALHVSCLYNMVKCMESLISQGADVNHQDQNGKTPLHYACECASKPFIEILLKSGAQLNIRDNNGYNALELAATFSYENVMVLLEECDSAAFSVQDKIFAFEASALLYSGENSYDRMVKATHLRVEHNLPKTVLEPLKCYDFTKEWETVEELAECQHDFDELQLHAILARDRIYQERYLGLIPLEVQRHILKQLKWNNKEANAQLRHQLKRREKALDSACSMYPFSTNYDFVLTETRTKLERLETASVVELIRTAMESCKAIQGKLEVATKPSCILEMTQEFETVLMVAGVLILKLVRRNKAIGSRGTEKALALTLLKELLESLPKISHPDTAYQATLSCLVHVLIDYKYAGMLDNFCLQEELLIYDTEMLVILIDLGFDVNTPDSRGNTLLHAVVKQVSEDMEQCGGGFGRPMQLVRCATETVKLLVERGAYVHAKNKAKETALDMLNNYMPSHAEVSGCGYLFQVKTILEEYDQLEFPTLKHQAAIAVQNSNLPYEDVLPKPLGKFVSLH